MRSRESLIGSLATSVRHRSIEWPCGLMAEVDTEWCRGLEKALTGGTLASRDSRADLHYYIVATMKPKKAG
jgi:hypothetical protein